MRKTNLENILLISLLLFSIVTIPSLATAQTDAINSAKQQMVTCYEAAKEAQAAGANITSLTLVLNEAGNLLSQAELATSQGDTEAATNLAIQSREMLANFVSDANALKQTAIQQRNTDFLINVVGSIAGTFVVFGVGIAVWVLLKKRYPETGEPST